MRSFRGFSFRYRFGPRLDHTNIVHNRVRIKLNGIDYDSITDASKSIEGLSKSVISNILNGKLYKKWQHLKIEKI